MKFYTYNDIKSICKKYLPYPVSLDLPHYIDLLIIHIWYNKILLDYIEEEKLRTAYDDLHNLGYFKFT